MSIFLEPTNDILAKINIFVSQYDDLAKKNYLGTIGFKMSSTVKLNSHKQFRKV